MYSKRELGPQIRKISYLSLFANLLFLLCMIFITTEIINPIIVMTRNMVKVITAGSQECSLSLLLLLPPAAVIQYMQIQMYTHRHTNDV